MKSTIIYEGKHQWIAFGRDPDKPEKIIDTNQYMVIDGNRSLLMDPGGIEIFSSMLASVLRHAEIDNITDIFASHQDPDIFPRWVYGMKPCPVQPCMRPGYGKA